MVRPPLCLLLCHVYWACMCWKNWPAGMIPSGEGWDRAEGTGSGRRDTSNYCKQPFFPCLKNLYFHGFISKTDPSAGKQTLNPSLWTWEYWWNALWRSLQFSKESALSSQLQNTQDTYVPSPTFYLLRAIKTYSQNSFVPRTKETGKRFACQTLCIRSTCKPRGEELLL